MAETDFTDRSGFCPRSDMCPVTAGCAPTRVPLCRRVLEVHDELLALCQDLEAIADSLPFRIERLRCLRVANELIPLLRQAHRLEENSLFPAFEGGTCRGDERHATVLRLKAEHVYDEGSAEGLTEILLEMGHGAPVGNPEALGYMLRAFFDAVRRHIAFEQEHILMSAPPGGMQPAKSQ